MNVGVFWQIEPPLCTVSSPPRLRSALDVAEWMLFRLDRPFITADSRSYMAEYGWATVSSAVLSLCDGEVAKMEIEYIFNFIRPVHVILPLAVPHHFLIHTHCMRLILPVTGQIRSLDQMERAWEMLVMLDSWIRRVTTDCRRLESPSPELNCIIDEFSSSWLQALFAQYAWPQTDSVPSRHLHTARVLTKSSFLSMVKSYPPNAGEQQALGLFPLLDRWNVDLWFRASALMLILHR